MKVLTDWQSGPPPCDGVWLVRAKGTSSYGIMMRTSPERWGGTFSDEWEWRGLAFNPESASTWDWVYAENRKWVGFIEGYGLTVITEFIE